VKRPFQGLGSVGLGKGARGRERGEDDRGRGSCRPAWKNVDKPTSKEQKFSGEGESDLNKKKKGGKIDLRTPPWARGN